MHFGSAPTPLSVSIVLVLQHHAVAMQALHIICMIIRVSKRFRVFELLDMLLMSRVSMMSCQLLLECMLQSKSENGFGCCDAFTLPRRQSVYVGR